MLDPHLPLVESWLAAEPHLTAIAILGRQTRQVRRVDDQHRVVRMRHYVDTAKHIQAARGTGAATA